MTRYLKTRVAVLISLLFNCVFLHAAEKNGMEIATVPPFLDMKWDIRKKGSAVKQYFRTVEHRSLDFTLGFGSKNSPDDPDQSWRKNERNWEFIWGVPGGNRKGVAVPVSIKLEKLEESGSFTVILEETVMTEGLDAGGRLVTRRIVRSALRPGLYRVTAITLSDSDLPDSLGTYLRIEYYAKSGPY